jgi:predicted GNAT family acetyltransferase
MTDVIDNAAENRYELLMDGHLSVADYYKNGNTLAITHVEVPQALRGKGVAAQLMAGIVLDAKAKNLTIHPICSYAASYMQRHPQ